MSNSERRSLLLLLVVYGATSLVHFIHNAEFLDHYPNLPSSWNREGVYFAWVVITGVGLIGWQLLSKGNLTSGLLVLGAYSGLGFVSIGHYVVARFSDHTAVMNTTILAEVLTAVAVLWRVMRIAWSADRESRERLRGTS